MSISHTKVSVDIETELLDRFREIYPQHGMTKWFFNECLRAFEEIHDPEKIPTEIRLAVERAILPQEEE